MITERMQQNLLYRLFATDEEMEEVDVSRWTEPWRTIALLASRAEAYSSPLRDTLWEALISTTHGDYERARELDQQIRAAAGTIEFQSLYDIADTLPPISWLWQNWLPRGMLSLLGAFQGTGKSWFVLDIARALIDGGSWPDGSPVGKAAPVIYVDAEGIPQVLNERAVTLGMDRRKLYLLMAEPGEIYDLSRAVWRDHLLDAAHALKPGLIIIDSLSSISSAGQNSVEEINALLAFLTGLARIADCAMLLIHHLRKPSGGQMYLPGLSIHDFRGSGHITAMARTVLGLSVIQSGKQFSLNGPRRLDLVKTNLGPYPDPIGIEMVSEGSTTRFVYGCAPDFERTETKSDNVEDWLVEFLEEGGPARPSEIVAAGEEHGFKRTMIYDARKKLGSRIVNTHGYRNPKNVWALPHQLENVEQEGQNEE